MSSSLIKANNISYGKKDKRVIDSNQAVFERLQFLSEIMESQDSDETYDDFVEGLNAENVDALLADPDAEDDAYNEVDLEATNAQVQQMLDDAQAQAQSIIDNANTQAQDIIANAQSEAENIKSAAYEEGSQAGYDNGYNEGTAKAAALEEEINERAARLQEEYDNQVAELEPKMVALITDIYSHIFNVDLKDKTEIVFHLLKGTIAGIESSQNFFVHVSPDDYDEVCSKKEELSTGLASTCVVEVISDITLPAGNAFIETEGGIFDCSLGVELSNLQKELKLLSYSPVES